MMVALSPTFFKNDLRDFQMSEKKKTTAFIPGSPNISTYLNFQWKDRNSDQLLHCIGWFQNLCMDQLPAQSIVAVLSFGVFWRDQIFFPKIWNTSKVKKLQIIKTDLRKNIKIQTNHAVVVTHHNSLYHIKVP